MTSPVSGPIATNLQIPGREVGQGVIAGTQGPIRPEGAQTSRAPLPVEPAVRNADLRLLTARDQPVGPSPAFVITLLQHLRDTAFNPPEVTAPAPEGESDPEIRLGTNPAPAGLPDAGSRVMVGADSATAGSTAAYADAFGSMEKVGTSQVDWRF